ncbi:MAG: hypothetical protein F9K24_04925 [Leptonema illini]|jgi:hypothetical protein|uniref:Uncharacterized protein n=1 Tax=Leptonema illini TaxID=183 RepID=A0A833LYG3_9LEPT|nr:MAG: hypothetical protein F9K24_04925 [Leptonema illini]
MQPDMRCPLSEASRFSNGVLSSPAIVPSYIVRLKERYRQISSRKDGARGREYSSQYFDERNGKTALFFSNFVYILRKPCSYWVIPDRDSKFLSGEARRVRYNAKFRVETKRKCKPESLVSRKRLTVPAVCDIVSIEDLKVLNNCPVHAKHRPAVKNRRSR